MRFAIVTSLFIAASLMACTAQVADLEDDAIGDESSEIQQGPAKAAYVGGYAARNQTSEDFGSLELAKDGTYTARVLTSIVGNGLLCKRAPCNDSEAGKWSISSSKDGIDRLRLKPASQAARIYRATRLADSGALFLERGGVSQTLQLETIPFHAPKCAVVLCSPGTQCVEQANGEIACIAEAIPFHAPKCAAVLCAPGTQCVEANGAVSCVAEAIPFHAPKCAAVLCAPETHCIERADKTVACVK